MNIDSFFAHHEIRENPFGAEEARHDPVFGRLAPLAQKNHPEFDRVLGRIDSPHASVVFGEKGAGKTALRMLIGKAVVQHNTSHEKNRTLLVAYDDLNPVLDRFARHRHGPVTSLLKRFRLQDHQDAILGLAVTKLVDALLGEGGDEEKMVLPADANDRIRSMPRHLRVDTAVLAALYDQPRSGNLTDRWRRLRRRMKLGWRLPFSVVKAGAVLLTVVAGGLFLAPIAADWFHFDKEHVPAWTTPAAGITAATAILVWLVWLFRHLGHWVLCRRIRTEAPTLDRTTKQLGLLLRQIPKKERQNQPWPLPGGDSTNSRYELTHKLVSVLGYFGYIGLIVVVDRVDEPTMVAGQTDRMRDLVWPLLEAKFLQQEGVGVKLLLPLDLRYLVHKEGSEFFQEARLDKQSLVDRLSWSGATLYDLCTARLRACTGKDAAISLTDLFDEHVTRDTLVEVLGQMNQPRDAFKLMYSVILEHCSLVPEEEAVYRIPKLTLESVRREQAQRIQDLHRGLSPA